MKIVGSDGYDDFDTERIFWVAVSDLPESIQAEAKRVDGQNYNPDCFGICVCYDAEKKEFELSPDERNTNIYYVKDDGDKAWFMAELPEGFLTEVYKYCQSTLLEKAGGIDGIYSGAFIEEQASRQRPSALDKLAAAKETAAKIHSENPPADRLPNKSADAEL